MTEGQGGRITVEETSVFGRKEGLATVAIDQELVIYDDETAELHVLDAIATVVWARLDGETSLGQTCQDLAANFAVDTSTVREDVAALVADLAAKGLVVDRAEAGVRR